MTSKSSLSRVTVVVATILLLKHFSEAQSPSDEDLSQCLGCRQYYIVTSPDQSCPSEYEMCLTLNQFASNTSHMQEDTRLVLQREQHGLDTQLTVANVARFSLIAQTVGNHSGSDVVIVCSERFIFENVSKVYLRGVLLVNCTQNVVENVEQITIVNCTFDRQNENGDVFHVTSSTANFTDCRFTRTPLKVSYYDQQSNLVSYFPTINGRYIFSTHRTIITIGRSVFEKKGPMNGVAIQVEDKGELFMNRTSFTTITANGAEYYADDGFYDAVHAYGGSSVVINYSTFDRGRSEFLRDFRPQATIFSSPELIHATLRSIASNLSVHGCTYNNSFVTNFVYGSESNVTLSETTIESNMMHICIVASNGNTTIRNCIIKNNQFIQGLIFDCPDSPMGSQFTLLNSSIVDNRAVDLEIIRGLLLDNIANFDVNYYDINTSIDNLINNLANRGLITIIEGNANVYNCTFSGNYEAGIIRAAVVNIAIDNCTFEGNQALFGAALLSYNSSTIISNAQILNNKANFGGVVLISNGELNSENMLLRNNTARGIGVLSLLSCDATFNGSTLLKYNVGSLTILSSTVTVEGSMHIENCTQSNNSLVPLAEGGAITVFLSSVTFHAAVTLGGNSAENGGAMFISDSQVFMTGPMVNIKITNNRASSAGGAIYLHQSRLNLQGVCDISNNTAVNGGGIYAVSSTIVLEDSLIFYNVSLTSNYAYRSGGAVFLSTNSKLYAAILFTSTITAHPVYLIKNSAENGGAVYIEDQTNNQQCNSSSSSDSVNSIASTECFFQILAVNPEEYPFTQTDVKSLTFTNNDARSAGDAIFGGLLDRCTVHPLNPSRNIIGASVGGISFLINVSNIDNTDSIASQPVRLCFCDSGIPNCSASLAPIYVKKGQMFSISLVAVDQVNHTLGSDVTASLSSNDGGFREEQQIQRVSASCSVLIYNVMTPHDSEELILSPVGPCGDAYPSQKRVQLVFDNCTCPTGFQPVTDSRAETNCICECHSNITKYVESCNSATETFQRSSNSWISNTTIPGSQEQFLLIHPQCPYDYCRSENEQFDIALNSPDGYNVQCAFNRNGTLCGQCLLNFSLSLGSSKCIKCENHWPGALVGITLLSIVFGIGLVCALLFLNLTVAIGTINGILFYANIISGNTSLFFNELDTTSFPSLFTAWLNLNIGFDVCIYKGLDTYAKTWIELVFPIYLIVLVVMVIVISRYSQRFANLIGKRNPVATLATLMLIFYAKFLSTVITIFSAINLKYPEGNRLLWKPDATIRYLEFPKHGLLFIVGLVILFLGAVYTILLFLWPLLVRLPNWKFVGWIRNPKLSSFIETYHAPYTARYRYWTGLLLFIRVIVYLATASNTTGNIQVPLLATTVTVGSLLLLTNMNVYKQKPVNFLEMVSLLNVLIFTLITWYAADTGNAGFQIAAAYVSILVTTIQLLIILPYHVYTFTFIGDKIKETNLYTKLSSLTFHVQESMERKEQISTAECNLEADTREVNLFELVTQVDSRSRRKEKVLRQRQPTVSIVEMTPCDNDQPRNEDN